MKIERRYSKDFSMFCNSITYALNLPAYIKDMHASWFGPELFQLGLSSSIKMSYGSETFTTDAHLSFDEDEEFLGFYFNLGNSFSYSFSGSDQPPHVFHKNQFTLLYMPHTGCTYDFTKGSASAFWLHFPSSFLYLAKDRFLFLKELLAAVEQKETYEVCPEPVHVSGEMLDVITSILYDKHSVQTRDTFFHFRLVSLFFKCLERIEQAQNQAENHSDSYEREKVSQVKKYVCAHLCDHLTLNDLADEISVAPRTLSRIFKKTCNESVMEFVLQRRMEQAMDLLKNSNMSIEKIGKMVGYRFAPHFTRAFIRRFGFPPKEIRDNCKSES